MFLDLSGKDFLSPEEFLFLVNGIREIFREDRYAEIEIRGSRGVCSQIRLLTRWSGNLNSRQDIITLTEV